MWQGFMLIVGPIIKYMPKFTIFIGFELDMPFCTSYPQFVIIGPGA
jgi:hypothetical protein